MPLPSHLPDCLSLFQFRESPSPNVSRSWTWRRLDQTNGLVFHRTAGSTKVVRVYNSGSSPGLGTLDTRLCNRCIWLHLTGLQMFCCLQFKLKFNAWNHLHRCITRINYAETPPPPLNETLSYGCRILFKRVIDLAPNTYIDNAQQAPRKKATKTKRQ